MAFPQIRPVLNNDTTSYEGMKSRIKTA